jgi:broad specificity phosphatase PhoE
MADPGTLWLVRHAERMDEVERYRGLWEHEHHPWDPPITAVGIQQAQHTSEALAHLPVVALYCSPLLRCIQTAIPLANQYQLPIRIVPGLGECAKLIRMAGLHHYRSAFWQADDLLRRYRAVVITEEVADTYQATMGRLAQRQDSRNSTAADESESHTVGLAATSGRESDGAV